MCLCDVFSQVEDAKRNTPNKILLYFKVSESKYCNKILYCNNAKYYQDNSSIGDKFEGIVAMYKATNLNKISLITRFYPQIKSKTYNEYLLFYFDDITDKPLYCLYGAKFCDSYPFPGFKPKAIVRPDEKVFKKFSENKVDFGVRYFCANNFEERFGKNLKSRGIDFIHSQVKYIEKTETEEWEIPHLFEDDFDRYDSLFYKSKCFEFESEHRVVIKNRSVEAINHMKIKMDNCEPFKSSGSLEFTIELNLIPID